MKPNETKTHPKTVLLSQLQLEKGPVSLRQLASKLDNNFAERSLRRWLEELIKSGQVTKYGKKRSTQYEAINHTHEEKIDQSFSQHSLEVIAKIRKPLYERDPISYNENWLKEYTPNKTFYVPEALLAKLYKAGKRSNNNEPAGLHYLLTDGLVDAYYAGRIRDHGVRVSGTSYIPIESMKKLKAQLELIIKKAVAITNPYEQSIFLLVHISYLQAFIDVNKRTARLAANIPLIANNLAPLSFNDIDKEDYISALIAIYELQDVRPMIDIYVYSYLRTCVSYDSTIKEIEFDEIRVRYRIQRRELLRQIILGNLLGADLESFILSRAKKIANQNDLENFIGDVQEDLKLLDETRIAGLGITSDQLKKWLLLSKIR